MPEKVFIARIQFIILKFTGFKKRVPVGLIKSAQVVDRALLLF